MKKILAGLFIVFTALAVMHTEGYAKSDRESLSEGAVFDDGDLKYEVTKQSTLEVIGFSDAARCKESLVISSFDVSKNGKILPVTGIREAAFQWNQSLTGVYIGTIGNKYDGRVFSIGRNAFRGCKSLNNVSIFKTNTCISENAFADCRSKQNNDLTLKIAAENVSIGAGVFTGFNNLEFSCKTIGTIGKAAFDSSISNLGVWADYEKVITDKLTKSGVSVIENTYEATRYM